MNVNTRKWLCGVVMPALAIAFLSGCVARKGGAPVSDTLAGSAGMNVADMTDMERFVHDYRSAGATRMQEQWAERAGSVVADTAKTALGTAYVRGGTTPAGFDCSGFVQWAYRHVGVSLPRTAREQSQVGEPVDSIEDLRVGDIVAFRHPRRGYHTGIYTGNGKFIHSPRRRETVRIASLSDPYFRTTFVGARRVEIPRTTDIDAVEKKMTALAEAKKVKSRLVASLDTSKKRSDAKSAGNARVTTGKKVTEKSRSVSRSSARTAKKTVSSAKPTGKATAAQATRKTTATKPTAKTTARKTTAARTSGAAVRGKATAPAKKAQPAAAGTRG